MQDATCPVCGGAMPPREAGAAGRPRKFCSDPCRRAASRDRSYGCSIEDCARPARAKGLCNTHYKAQHPNRTAWKKNGDPEVRRAALRRKTQQRRARTKGDAEAELIDRDEIGARDGWRCGLCAGRIDSSLPYPHPRSASLDHIEPLSLGGKHTKANVQIAHLTCNVAKGNRGGGEQLLLIG